MIISSALSRSTKNLAYSWSRLISSSLNARMYSGRSRGESILQAKIVMERLDRLRRINIRLVSQTDLLDDALRIALNIEITVYDALYCALARRENAEIITEDRRLRNALDQTNIRYLTLRTWAE